jgi:hypothetical protein
LVSRVQTQRLSAIGVRPVAGSRAPGELYVNWPDMQLGVIDESKTPNDLLAVRFFSVNTNYASGDVVWQGGHLWHANQAIPAGPFNPAQWDQNTTAGSGNYLPLTGGTMTGALVLAGDPTGPLGAATKQYIDNNKLALSGGTLTGGLTLSAGNLAVSAGNISASGSGTFGSVQTATITTTGVATVNSLISNSVVSTKGSTNGFDAYDRGNSGGNTADFVGLYRDANIGRLSMTEFGDVLQMTSAGAATFLGTLHANAAVSFGATLAVSTSASVGTALTVGTTISAGSNITAAGSITATNGSVASEGPSAFLQAYDRGNAGGNTAQSVALYRDGNTGYLWGSEPGGVMSWTTAGNATFYHSVIVNGSTTCAGVLSASPASTHYPIQVTTTNGFNAAIYFNPTGQDSWLVGPMATIAPNTFIIYDNTSGGQKITCTASQVSIYGFTSLAGGGACQAFAGANGAWEVGEAMLLSPQSSSFGAGGALGTYCGTASGVAIKSRVDVTSAYLAYFAYSSTNVGYISTNGSTTFYATSCDAELKENVRSLSSELDIGSIIDAIEPVAFEWKATRGSKSLAGEDRDLPARTGYGFVAQDLHKVVPDVVVPGQKAVDEYHSSSVWAADYSKLVPYLVAEIQSLRARLAKVEGKFPG